MGRKSPGIRAAVVWLLGLTAALCFTNVPAAPSGQATLLGKTYGEWSAEW